MTQMARYKANGGGYKSPKLVLQDVDDFYKFDSSKECLCAKLEGYKHMGKLKFPLAQ
jgi:thymidylate synthase